MNEPTNKPNGIYISVDQVYNLMQETNVRLAEIRSDIRLIAEKAEAAVSDIVDHEARIRSLEKWKYGIPLTAVTAICSVIATVLLSFVL